MIKHISVIFILFMTLVSGCYEPKGRNLPNIVFILADDLGYGDLGCYGNQVQKTPNLDKLASEGIRLTDFYAAASVCTPTRAAFMTGSYPRRVSLQRDSKEHCVLIPGANKGLALSEVTIAEILKSRGYATGCFGKWHLGDQNTFLPANHGFDLYFGVPYSNDMDWAQRGDPPLPLVRNDRVIESGTNQDSLTIKCTSTAIRFIYDNYKTPFFVYLPYNMPHNPVHASVDFRGKSRNGIYGDAVQEIDYSVGRILKVLDSLGIAEKTLFVFTSDNGAAKPFGGSNKPLSGWKGSDFEGGFRVPCIIRWPEVIADKRTDDSFTNIMDFLPTFAEVVGYELEENRMIDGRSMLDLLKGALQNNDRDRVFYYYYRNQLQAVRKGPWKLFLPLDVKQVKWDEIIREGPGQDVNLVNLDEDPGEFVNLAEQFPEILTVLKNQAEKARLDLGDDQNPGENQRPAGWIDFPRYLIKE